MTCKMEPPSNHQHLTYEAPLKAIICLRPIFILKVVVIERERSLSITTTQVSSGSGFTKPLGHFSMLAFMHGCILSGGHASQSVSLIFPPFFLTPLTSSYSSITHRPRNPRPCSHSSLGRRLNGFQTVFE